MSNLCAAINLDKFVLIKTQQDALHIALAKVECNVTL